MRTFSEVYIWEFQVSAILYFLWINLEQNIRVYGWFVWRFGTATFTTLKLEFSLSTIAVSWIVHFFRFCRTVTHGCSFAEYCLLLATRMFAQLCEYRLSDVHFSILIHCHFNWMQRLNCYPWSGWHGF